MGLEIQRAQMPWFCALYERACDLHEGLCARVEGLAEEGRPDPFLHVALENGARSLGQSNPDRYCAVLANARQKDVAVGSMLWHLAVAIDRFGQAVGWLGSGAWARATELLDQCQAKIEDYDRSWVDASGAAAERPEIEGPATTSHAALLEGN